jgi:ABC-2 type transport system ATP-binding protein
MVSGGRDRHGLGLSSVLAGAISGRVSFQTTLEPGDAIVDVHGLQKSYGGRSLFRRRRVDALCGVSLSANAGEVFGLLGPNGAGKTTLIKILLGVVKPSAGTASLFGESVGSSAARQRVGYLPESLRVDRHHTARSALRYYGRLSRMNSTEIARRSDELLELVGLRGRDRESVRRFSKGMYQRLGLAQALMHDPDLLVLDEPTDGLDPVGRNDVRKVIERLRDSGKTIFLNSHILQEVEMVCTRVAILDKGEIRVSGRIDELSLTEQTEQVAFEVAVPSGLDGDSASLSNCFDPQGLADLVVTPLQSGGRTHRVTVTLTQQRQIDDAVDRLRAAGISLVRLEVKRPTLEDTFMKLVGNTESTL